ncbi:hypothetical protein Poli38472_009790 [Pythium oligandrum]|uniref:Leucine-rich repeat-containing protein 57 n=1 Tax=Pythium oligandrum TaxID=41045 RepID=A0A8K1FJY8_PYTOL|nr:hypothetical protein Poli38472_009790 [Pythium oligandrum]|eukprot:TMW62297.1 hypothetical protein Poli38472_009790 [Pythium oligandrum]
MGQAATKAKEAHTQAKSKPKNNRNVQNQKIQTAKSTGMLALPERKLKKVPAEVLELTQLRSLDLSQNRLEEIPAELNAFASLKTLKLVSNALTTLPDLSGLTALTTLVLDGNSIESLPNALPPNLTKLSLKGNKLSAIPQTITSLSQLKELDLSENQLSEIPQHINQLSELVDLSVDRNSIQILPSALVECPKLKVISARHNQLRGGKAQSIAESILKDSIVQIMNLEGNPMTKFDLEAMEGCEAFLQRRTQLKNKEIHGGLSTDTSLCGLD